MILLLTTLAVAVGSALLPFINIEVYLGGVAAATDVHGLTGVLVAASAAAGQTIGKVIWYEIAHRGIDTDWAQKKLDPPKVRANFEKWRDRIQGRPWYAGAIMFLAASAGIPPLLVMAVVAGALKMPRWVFIPTVLVGRAVRFYLILVGVDFLFH